jgi:long-chain acyl-CoA synthetase
MDITRDDLALESAYRWERERGGRVFLTQPFGGGQVRHWTWAQAVGEARRMAAYLRAQNWEPGSRIAILSKNCAWWMMADLAIWMSGHTSVPIYPSLRAQSIRQILEHSGAVACFVGATDEKAAEDLGTLPGLTCISFPTANEPADLSWESLVEANAPIGDSPTRAADDLATIIYTSGTTGTPKGVMHRFGAFAYDSKVLTTLLNLKPEERVLSYLPLAHIVERVGVEACSCRMGWHLYFSEGIETFLTDLQRARPTLFLSVPRLLLKFQQGVFANVPKEKLDRLLRIPAFNLFVRRKVLRKLGLGTVQHAACGAAPLPTEILVWYRKIGLDLAEGYGMTETMITHLPRPGLVHPGYVGQAIEGVETRLTPEGELLVRSPMNMLGYYKDPKTTSDAFTEDGFFRTGDVVTLDNDGQLRIIGRIKEQFKTSKGKYVAPAPIEGKLMEHPSVEACCLMGAGQPSPFAVIVLAEAERARCADSQARKTLEESLRARMESINSVLDPYERIDMIVIADGPWTISNGLMTPTLKIKRGILESRYQVLIDEWRARNRAIVWESTPGAYMPAAAAENSLRQSDCPPSQT